MLEYLRQRSAAEADPSEVPQLIAKLGSADFAEREKAEKTLVAIGPPAIPALWEATKHPDKQVAHLAKNCITRIGRVGELYPAVVRQLVKSAPKGALEALLAFVPYAASEDAIEEVWYAVDALAGPDSRLDPKLVAALADRSPARRALAGCIVGRRGTPEQRAAVKKLFADKFAEVRLRAAQGLLASADQEAIPVLIALL